MDNSLLVSLAVSVISFTATLTVTVLTHRSMVKDLLRELNVSSLADILVLIKKFKNGEDLNPATPTVDLPDEVKKFLEVYGYAKKD